MSVKVTQNEDGRWSVTLREFNLVCNDVAEADQLAADLEKALGFEANLRVAREIKDQARIVANLGQLVMSLCRQLPPDHEWREKAHDALKRWGVFVSPLKEGKYMVKRYDVSWSPGGYQMVEGDDFVMADDYDAIEAENAKLRELLRRAWDCTHSATLLVDMRKELLTLRPEIKAALEPSGDSGEGKP